MQTETGRFYRFESFRLDPGAKMLFCNDQPIALTPKVFDTLHFLVEHPGRLLEKDELMQAIWQDRFVEESNLSFNIKVLRRALKDDPNQPRFIETVRGRGYRFIAEVQEVFPGVTAERPVNENPHDFQPATPKRSYLSVTAISILALLAVLTVAWIGRGRLTASTRAAPILSSPFESEVFSSGGSVYSVITPDGKYVAYTSESGGKHSLWLRQLATAENIQIVPPADGDYLGLTASHDGNSLYYVRRIRSNSYVTTLYRVTTFGGIPVRIADEIQGWVSVSPDDRHISFVRCRHEDNDFCSLHVADYDGQNERRLLTLTRPVRISDNQFSPDGKSIAFAVGQSESGSSDFRLKQLDLASGAVSEISGRTFFEVSSLKWLPDQSGLLVTAKESLDGRSRIWHVSAATRTAQPLTKDATDYISLSLDQAADKIVAKYVTNTFHLYTARLDDLSNPRSLAVARTGFSFTADGQKIVYEGNDGDIWTIGRDGGEQRQLTNNSSKDFMPFASPDGHIFFTSNRSGANQVWRINNDGTNPVQISKTEGGYPRFVSPDGKWVYFDSGPQQTLWRVPSDGGTESRVFEGKVREPSFSPDGKSIACIVFGEEGYQTLRLAVMSVANGKTTKIFRLGENRPQPPGIAWATAWGADNNSVYYVLPDGRRNALWRQFLNEENAHFVADLGEDEVSSFAITPDGKSVAFIRGKWILNAAMIRGLK